MPAPVYNKQNFIDETILYAEQLNKIEHELHEISKEPNVFIQDTQPEGAVEGDIWIVPPSLDMNGDPLEIPYYTAEDYGKVLMVTEFGLKWVYASEYDELKNAEQVSF